MPSGAELLRQSLNGTQPDREPGEKSLGGSSVDVGRQLPGMFESIEEALPSGSFSNDIEAYKRIRSMPTAAGKLRALSEMEKLQPKMDAFRSNLSETVGTAAMAGGPNDAMKAAGFLRDSFNAVPGAETAKSLGAKALDFVDPVKPIVKGAFAALDKAHEYAVRQNTMPGVPNVVERLVRGQPIESISDEEWNKAIDKRYRGPEAMRAGRGEYSLGPFKVRGGPEITDALVSAGDIVGGALGSVPGLAYGAVLGAADLKEGRPQDPEQWSRALGKGVQFGQHLTRSAATDPTNLVSLGSGSVAKQSAGVAGRLGKAAGLSPAATNTFVDDVARVMRLAGETSDAPEAFLSAAKRAGIPEAEVRKALGPNLEYLGRGQLEIGPLPLAKATGVEYPLLKAVDKIGAKLGKKGSFFDPTERYALGSARGARATEQLATTRNLKELDSVAEAIRPVGIARFQELVERNIDAAADTLPMKEAQAAGWLNPPNTPKIVDGPSGPVVVRPTADYIPDSALTPEELKLVNTTRDWLEGVRQNMVLAGVKNADAQARNILTDKFFPRRYEYKGAFMEDLVDARGGRPERQGQAMLTPTTAGQPLVQREYVRPGGVALGELAGKKYGAKWGAAETLQQYARQAGRAEGKAQLEREIAIRFGKKMGPADHLSGLDRGFAKVTVDGDTYKVPAAAADVLNRTFDPTWNSFSNFLRSMGADNSSAGRVALGAMDTYRSLVGYWKGNILRQTPGYHVVNIWNDLFQMAADGNTDPRFMAHALKVLRAGKNPNAVIDLGNGVRMTAKEVRDLANREGLALELSERAGIMDEGVGRTFRQFKAKAEPTPLRKVVAKAEQLNPGEFVERVTSTPLRVAHFLWAISKGDSPKAAAERVARVLLDYGDKSRKLKAARWLFPFITWQAKAPAMAARLVANRPGRVMTMDRAVRGVGEEDMEARRHTGQAGEYVVLGDEPSKALAELGGWRHTPGYRTSLLTKNPIVDAYQIFPQTARALGEGSLAPVAGMLGPAQKAALEIFSGQDAANPQAPGFKGVDPFSPFPYGTTGNTWLDAQPGAISPFARYVAPMLPGIGNPYVLMKINQLLRESGGPATTFGSARLYTSTDDPESQQARQAANFWTRLRPGEVSPIDAYYNAANDPAKARAIQAMQDAQKGVEKRLAPPPAWAR